MKNWFTLDVLRQILMTVGAIVAAFGWSDEATIQTMIGVVMTVASAVWQLFDHNKVQTAMKVLQNEVKSLKALKTK